MLQIIFVEIYSPVVNSLVVEIGFELSQLVIEISAFEVSFIAPYKGIIRQFAL